MNVIFYLVIPQSLWAFFIQNHSQIFIIHSLSSKIPIGIPAILFVQPMIGAFNKSDSNTNGMPLEVKGIYLEVNKMSFRNK